MDILAAAPELETADPGDGDGAYYRDVLHGLIDGGAALARLVVEQAIAGVMPAADAVVAHERAARSVRRTVLLVRSLDAPVRVTAMRRAAARRQIIRVVEDAIQRETDGDEAAALRAEVLDRLDGPELEEEIGDRPVDAIIADICRNLGLGAMPGTHPWTRRRPADVAALFARAAAVGVRVAGYGCRAAGASEATAGVSGAAGCRGP